MRSTALVAEEQFASGETHVSTTALVEPSGDDRADVAGAVGVAGVDYLSIYTPELRRSVELYSRVFGFCVVGASHDRAGRSVLMAAGRLYLAIRERPRGEFDSTGALGWSFVVDDLDRARAITWDLGIVPIRDGTHEPQCDSPWRRRRSFVIRDPDGNEIEVVERAG
ncbi:MAG TPA: VOC family protein [Gammaproteobacteria bacterium]